MQNDAFKNMVTCINISALLIASDKQIELKSLLLKNINVYILLNL